MARIAAILLLAVLLAPHASASTTIYPGQVHHYHFGGPSTLQNLADWNPRDGIAQVCTDDIFFVTATLSLINPDADDAVGMTTDHAGLPPAVVVTAATPTGKLTVRLGGCDRGFDIFVAGLSGLDGAQYSLTFS